MTRPRRALHGRRAAEAGQGGAARRHRRRRHAPADALAGILDGFAETSADGSRVVVAAVAAPTATTCSRSSSTASAASPPTSSTRRRRSAAPDARTTCSSSAAAASSGCPPPRPPGRSRSTSRTAAASRGSSSRGSPRASARGSRRSGSRSSGSPIPARCATPSRRTGSRACGSSGSSAGAPRPSRTPASGSPRARRRGVEVDIVTGHRPIQSRAARPLPRRRRPRRSPRSSGSRGLAFDAARVGVVLADGTRRARSTSRIPTPAGPLTRDARRHRARRGRRADRGEPAAPSLRAGRRLDAYARAVEPLNVCGLRAPRGRAARAGRARLLRGRRRTTS